MKDSVGKWYKDRAEDLNVIPPYEAWGKVEKAMEDWPKHWYQSNAAGISGTSETQGWEAIAEQLEIQRNTRRSQRNFYLRTASMVAGLLLVPMWIANVANFSSNLETGNIDNGSIAVVENPISETVNAKSLINTVVETPIVSIAQATPAISTPAPTPVLNLTTAVIANTIPTPQELPEKTTLFALETRPADKLQENASFMNDLARRATESIRYTEPSEDLAHEQAKESQKNWLVGPTAVLGTSELLNPLSYRDDATTSSMMDVAYGVSASRNFKKNRVTADLLFNDTKSQMASLNSEEISTTLNFTTMALRYERIVPLFKSAQKLRPELNFGGGVFGSVLSNSTVVSNQANSYYSSFTYRNLDFGGVLTAGTSMQLGNSFRLGVNARIQSGAINLFEGREKIPSQMFRTQSLSTGIQMNLSYQF